MGKVALPRDFAITDEMRAWADSKVPSVDIDRETERFCDYWWAHGKPMADWEATWRMWIRRAPEMGGAMKPRIPLAAPAKPANRPVAIQDHPLFQTGALKKA